MVHRITIEADDGEEYWVDASNDLREYAINKAMSEGLTMQDALAEVLASPVVAVEQN